MPIFAPLLLPIERRLQTGAVLFWVSALGVTTVLFFYLCTLKYLWPLIIIYLLWVLMYDTAPERGGRRSNWWRNLAVWGYFAQYFPMTLIKEEDLDPSKNYIFGYHPHGILSHGALCTFATEGLGFSKKFPGIKSRLLTLQTNFNIPIYRDFIMALGCASVSKASCEYILKSGPGNSITIVVGGAQESLAAKPGTFDLTLKKRMGFIKIALVNGASLVPTLAFGENDLYELYTAPHASKTYKVQQMMKKFLGFTMPMFHGRGVFNYEFGLLPKRRPVHIVIGKPIHVVKVEGGPTTEQIQDLQKLYIDELLRIWECYKDKFSPNRTQELQLIE
ncbi:diacylglycerol O-acyltransferase 1 [Entomortierella chlamydospora]|uniref:Diacylglycerol O-acyltransferase n=1 Tax=Entomortierella chlamydospora TaxID=101097 RepID=A0A9P6N680_9FUNG|nr:diacylglycerol O-acyltransferase 1 [Entomortierella chlamydospora]KAG0024259.1 diacylglycerol O-acyltransferase 1 [Entomortierella chlamydospora]